MKFFYFFFFFQADSLILLFVTLFIFSGLLFGAVCYWCNKNETVACCQASERLSDVERPFDDDGLTPTTSVCCCSTAKSTTIKIDSPV